MPYGVCVCVDECAYENTVRVCACVRACVVVCYMRAREVKITLSGVKVSDITHSVTDASVAELAGVLYHH